MTPAPDHTPPWLLKMVADVASISTNTKNQGVLIDKIEDWVKEIDDDVDDLTNKHSVLKTKLKHHIRDEARHTAPGEMEDVVAEELKKYGFLNGPRQWADRHPNPVNAGMFALILGALEIARSAGII